MRKPLIGAVIGLGEVLDFAAFAARSGFFLQIGIPRIEGCDSVSRGLQKLKIQPNPRSGTDLYRPLGHRGTSMIAPDRVVRPWQPFVKSYGARRSLPASITSCCHHP